MQGGGKFLKIKISNSIEITEPTSQIKQYCKENLVLSNPDYYKLERLGKWTGNTPKEIALYEVQGDKYILPFGCLKTVWSMCPDRSLYEVDFRPIQRLEYHSSINLYPYQENAVQSILKGKNGVLVMPCGSGKTNCGIEVIARIGGRALWLTHTADLLAQSLSRAKSVLDCDIACFGTITGGKVEIGSHITFATVQTMCKLDLSRYKDIFDVIIVDEVQRVAGSPTRITQFYKVISSLSARYKIGLTATPKRADGLEKSMFALLGDIIHTVDRSEVAKNTCKIIVKTVETSYTPDKEAILLGDGTLDYMALIDDLTSNEKRFNEVLEVIERLDGSAIVLGNRIAYLQKLNQAYSGRSVCLSGMGYTKKAKAERVAALEWLRSGDLDCVFVSYKLAAEGLDVPNLKYVVFSTPEKNETTVIQAAGRVGRKSEGKEYGTVIDIVDDFPMYRSWANKRKGYYKKIGVTE